MSVGKLFSRPGPRGPQWPSGCWPNAEQLLLLQSCLLEDRERALGAFHEWQKSVPWFLIDAGSQKLLLLLWDRLNQWGVRGEAQSQMAGLARYHWTGNQLLLRQLPALLRLFREAGIETMLLKGAALNLTVYPPGARTMSDIDVVVPRSQALQAIHLLIEQGWRSHFRDPNQLLNVTHGCHFANDHQGELDLHWDFFHGRPLDTESANLLWGRSIGAEVGGEPTRILCPTDQFLHTCEHGARYNQTAPFRWLADATLILRGSEEIDWDRLFTLAERWQLVLPVRQTLQYLSRWLEVSIPSHAWEKLRCARAPWKSRVEHWLSTRRLPGSHPFWKELPVLLLQYLRIRKHAPGLRLSEYLQRVSNLEPPFSHHLRRLAQVELAAQKDNLRRVLRRAKSLFSRKRTDSFQLMAAIPASTLEGFYEPEEHEGIVFRWSQPRAASHLKLHREARELILRLAPLRPWFDDLRESINVRFNRTAIPRERLLFTGWDVRIPIEEGMLLSSPVQRLELRAPAWSPGNDPRSLGIPLIGLQYREA